MAGVAPTWASGLHTQMTGNEMTPTAQAETWVEEHVPHTDRLLTDDTVWVDLVDHGFDRPLGVVWFYKLGYVNNLDPSVSRTLGGGWRDFQYIDRDALRPGRAGRRRCRGAPAGRSRRYEHSYPGCHLRDRIRSDRRPPHPCAPALPIPPTRKGSDDGNRRECAHQPRFATVVRGYDRLQVDDYVDHLNQWIEQADDQGAAVRGGSCRGSHGGRRVAPTRRGPGGRCPDVDTRVDEGLGRAVSGRIMQSSFSAAKELHARAKQRHGPTTDAAEERPRRSSPRRRARADELSRAAESSSRRRRTCCTTPRAAAQEIEEAKDAGKPRREALLERARTEARELARRSAAEEQARREHVALLEEHRPTVLQEIGVLHERLGTISEGFASSQLPRSTTGTRRPDQPEQPEQPEQPAPQRPMTRPRSWSCRRRRAPRPGRRKAASSAR